MSVSGLIRADARHIPLRSRCAQTVVTSPPYYALRDYGVDGQIGLEETPDAYVQEIVAVFREVWRVLRDDGTLWLNLGDSYAQSGMGGNPDESAFRKQATNAGSLIKGRKAVGAKPKDLLGIPWRVAFALQQPWYAGQIPRSEDRAWLAAIIDGEGSICIERQRPVDGGRTKDYYASTLRVHNTSEAIVTRCHQLTGVGSVRVQDTRNRTIYVWCVYGPDARRVITEVYPHLVAKQHEARLALGRRDEAGYEALKLIHHGAAVDVDAPAPESLHTPGWYLRSDIIWHKPNPMPESVTDRPTKAHEYLFLLTKSERYFYDAEAVKEAATGQDAGNGFARPERISVGGRGNPEPWRASEDGKRNKRSVWSIPTMPYAGAHFATMPEKLIEPCILAGSRVGDLVLDPFVGSGTVGAVAERFGRKWVGLDLNHRYLSLAKERTRQAGLLSQAVGVGK